MRWRTSGGTVEWGWEGLWNLSWGGFGIHQFPCLLKLDKNLKFLSNWIGYPSDKLEQDEIGFWNGAEHISPNLDIGLANGRESRGHGACGPMSPARLGTDRWTELHPRQPGNPPSVPYLPKLVAGKYTLEGKKRYRVVAQQSEKTENSTVHLKGVKRIHFTLGVFYHN